MKLSNRKPLFLALALTFAAPIAFAQSTTTDASQQTQPTTTTEQSSTTQSTTQGTQSADTQSTDTQSSTTQPTTAQDTGTTTGTTSTTSSTAQTDTSGAPQKKNWSDLDTDKNGTLNASEAASVQSLSKAFAQADANADGELTQDEYKAYLAATGKGQADTNSGG